MAYVNIHVSRHLKVELMWATDKWPQVISYVKQLTNLLLQKFAFSENQTFLHKFYTTKNWNHTVKGNILGKCIHGSFGDFNLVAWRIS